MKEIKKVPPPAPPQPLDAALNAIYKTCSVDTGFLPLTHEAIQLAWLRGYTAARETALREWRAELERRS